MCLPKMTQSCLSNNSTPLVISSLRLQEMLENGLSLGGLWPHLLVDWVFIAVAEVLSSLLVT